METSRKAKTKVLESRNGGNVPGEILLSRPKIAGPAQVLVFSRHQTREATAARICKTYELPVRRDRRRPKQTFLITALSLVNMLSGQVPMICRWFDCKRYRNRGCVSDSNRLGDRNSMTATREISTESAAGKGLGKPKRVINTPRMI